MPARESARALQSGGRWLKAHRGLLHLWFSPPLSLIPLNQVLGHRPRYRQPPASTTLLATSRMPLRTTLRRPQSSTLTCGITSRELILVNQLAVVRGRCWSSSLRELSATQEASRRLRGDRAEEGTMVYGKFRRAAALHWQYLFHPRLLKGAVVDNIAHIPSVSNTYCCAALLLRIRLRS